MKKPEKKNKHYSPYSSSGVDLYNSAEQEGYNQAIDDYEKYHKWSVNIKDAVIKTSMKMYDNLPSIVEIFKILKEYKFKYYDEEGHNIEEITPLEDMLENSHIKGLAKIIYKRIRGAK